MAESGRKLTEDQLIAIVDQEIANSSGKAGSRLSDARQKAMQYYNGEAVGDLAPPEAEGRSAVVSLDVADTIEWILPSLLRIFTASDDAVVFEPQGQEDEEAAEQETDYVNYVFYRQNPGFVVLHNLFKDALLQRMGIVKIWWDDAEDIATEEYDGMTPEDLAMLMQDAQVEPTEAGRNDDGTYDVKVRRTRDTSQVRIENVPPEEFLFSRKARSSDRIFACHHRVLRTISELRAMGYRNVDQISSDDTGAEFSTERTQRRVRTDDYAPGQGDIGSTLDESMRQVWITESYLQVDWNGDGIAEWRKVVKANKTLLENEEVDEDPFSMCSPILMPHELVGKSIADLVLDIQRIKTAVTRQILDNMYLQNNPRIYVDESKSVNIDDLLDSRVGGIVRGKGQGALEPIVVPPLSAGSFGLLEYIDSMRENRTGITKYNQGLDADSLNKTATGINAIMNAAQQRIELIARIFAETGVKDIFRRVLKLTCQHQKQARVVRLRNKWVNIDPREWRTQFDMTINVGLGTGNKDQMAQHLMMLLQVQQQAGAAGIGVVTPKNVFNAASKLAENVGFKDGGQFFTDPTDPRAIQERQQMQALMPPPPPDPKMEELKLKQAQAQQDGQLRQQEFGLKAQQSQAELQLEREKAAARIQLEREVAAAQLQLEGGKALLQRDMQSESKRMDIEDAGKIRLEQRDHEVAVNKMLKPDDYEDEMKEMAQAVSQLARQMAEGNEIARRQAEASIAVMGQMAQAMAASASKEKVVSMTTSDGRTLSATVKPGMAG